MKKLTLGAIALLSALAAGPALADDTVVATAGPMTGGQATFGRQMRDGAVQAIADINAAGGVLGKKLRLEIVVDPGVRRLPRRQCAADHPGLDQSAVHRPWHVEHVPHLRP